MRAGSCQQIRKNSRNDWKSGGIYGIFIDNKTEADARRELYDMKNPFDNITFKCIAATIVILLLFAMIAGYIGYMGYTDALMGQYADGAFRLGEAAAAYIDADRLDDYLKNGGTGEDYAATWEKLDKLCNGAGVTFVYVIQPDLTDYAHIHFVFSTVNHQSKYHPYEVGRTVPTTNEEYKVKYRSLCEGEADHELLLLENRAFARSDFHLTAMVALKGDDGATKGILCVQRQTDGLAKARVDHVRKIMVVMLQLTALFVAWQGFYLGRILLSPIRTITGEASRFARENSAADSKLTETIRQHDEIGLLAASIDTMEEQVQSYILDLTKATAEKERIKAELDMAAQSQASAMPRDFPAFPERHEFVIYGAMDPAREVGGDFFDFFLLDGDHLCLVIADVSGKGIPGALFMMQSRIVLQNCAVFSHSPAEILTRANDALCRDNEQKMFVTVWLGILEISTGKLTAANAGHEYPALKAPGGAFGLFKDKHGFVIGGMEGMRYKEYELSLAPGAKLFVYTDGIPEATDPDENMFGTERMIAALNAEPDASPEGLIKNVRRAVDGFVRDAEQFDDMTMPCLEYRGPDAAKNK